MPKLTFKEIREKCKSGEHLLVDYKVMKRLFLGFDREGKKIITDQFDGKGATSFHEYEIENWKIEPFKQEPKFMKKTVYCPVCEEYIYDIYYKSIKECFEHDETVIGYSEQIIYVKE
jgi:hypothetical protein